jgi:hypothetical protein
MPNFLHFALRFLFLPALWCLACESNRDDPSAAYNPANADMELEVCPAQLGSGSGTDGGNGAVVDEETASDVAESQLATTSETLETQSIVATPRTITSMWPGVCWGVCQAEHPHAPFWKKICIGICNKALENSRHLWKGTYPGWIACEGIWKTCTSFQSATAWGYAAICLKQKLEACLSLYNRLGCPAMEAIGLRP